LVGAALGRTEPRRRDEPSLNAERFLRGVPGLFDDFPRSEHPLDRRFAPVLEQVENLTRENILALLNYAASCLGPEEAYVEVGVFHGASLIAAMLGNEERRFVGIDDFGLRGGSLGKLEANLDRFGLPRPEILVGDAFELVRGGALAGAPVGVWYYDALHTYDAQLEGLRIAEPLLAPGALVIVDDTDWAQVERALNDYLAEQPRARRILTIEGVDRGAAQWWEGMQVLEWTG
jgi:predicted O-methyltransferase YrrM